MASTSCGLIGERVAAVRIARGMTQRKLALLANVSLSLLRKVEQGRRSVSDQVLHSFASALSVEPDRLTDDRGTSDSRVHEAIPALRAAVSAYDLPDDGPVRSLRVLRGPVEEAVRARIAADYTPLAVALPDLVSELTRAFHSVKGAQAEEAAGLLAMAYRAADGVAFKYGYHDLSAHVIELIRWAASRSGDELLNAAAAYVRTEAFFANRDLPAGLRNLDMALGSLPPTETVDALATRGALHMRAAVVAGRLADEDLASVHLREARRAADRVPEGAYRGTSFGPSSVRIHEVSVAVELGDGARAMKTAREWAPARDLPAERRSHYYIDLAQAQLWLGQREGAFESLQVARRIAPQHAREHPRVRHALSTLLRLHRSPSQALRSYARWARAV